MTLARKTPMARTAIRPQSIAAPQKPRARKCAQCRQSFEPRPPGAKVCGLPCSILYTAAIRSKRERKADKLRKDALKGLRDWIADAQVAFNAYCRARDVNQFCISCRTHLTTLAGASGGGFDCGHYRSRGSAPHLRFDERNAHGQCKQCNRYGGGMAADYRIGLIARIGLPAVEALECDNAVRKYSIPELQGIKAHYKNKLKEIQK